jgi:hypothetical protein
MGEMGEVGKMGKLGEQRTYHLGVFATRWATTEKLAFDIDQEVGRSSKSG